MVAIGMVLIWGGYTIGIWGYCLVNGYDVTFQSLLGTAWTSAAQGQSDGAPLPVADPGTGVSFA
jgi:hypothetical protein